MKITTSPGQVVVSRTIDCCRSCGDRELNTFLDLGKTPLADRLLRREQLTEPEPRVPLVVAFCPACSLVQITETVAPEVLFSADYPYFSSVSPALREHFAASARALIDERRLGPHSRVIEAASNDGYMLRHFVAAGIPVLGIDPAAGPVAAAREAGVDTLHAFFTRELAEDLRKQGQRADLFLANNVLAHVADLNGFVAGMAELLADDGLAVIEVPYLLDLVDHCEFDTIYHQHLCYFSVTALDQLFRRHGLSLNRVRQVPIHGGSLRLFVEKQVRPHPSVAMLLAGEQVRGSDRLDFYQGFARRVEVLCRQLLLLLDGLRTRQQRIVGYGAAAKACTLMSVCGIGAELLDYLVDLNPVKQGLYMSGNRLPIHAPARLLEDRPDYLLILSWNFAPEIMAQQARYQQLGGRFIIPIPEVRIQS